MSNINFYISLLKEYSNYYTSIMLDNTLTYQQSYRIISIIKVEWQLQMFLQQLPLIKQFYVCVNQQYQIYQRFKQKINTCISTLKTYLQPLIFNNYNCKEKVSGLLLPILAMDVVPLWCVRVLQWLSFISVYFTATQQ